MRSGLHWVYDIVSLRTCLSLVYFNRLAACSTEKWHTGRTEFLVRINFKYARALMILCASRSSITGARTHYHGKAYCFGEVCGQA